MPAIRREVNMYNSNIALLQNPVIWPLEFNYNDIYSIVSTSTVYDASKAQAPESTVMMDDDKPMYRFYLSMAISDLTSLLARRIDTSIIAPDHNGEQIDNEGMLETSSSVTYHLVMDGNCESHLRTALWRYCNAYIVARVLEQWHKSPQGAEELRKNILRTLEFRRKPVRRPITSLL